MIHDGHFPLFQLNEASWNVMEERDLWRHLTQKVDIVHRDEDLMLYGADVVCDMDSEHKLLH